MNLKAMLPRSLLYILLILFAFFFLLPFYADITTSLKTGSDVIKSSPITLPPSPTLEPWLSALGKMGRPLLNSLAFTVFATIFSCLIGSINGYVLSKIRFRGSDLLFLFFCVGIFIPYQTVLIPLVLTMARLGLYNTLAAMVLTHTAYGIPICTLIFRNFYKELPDSLVMAAKIDGAGTWRIYQSILLPLSLSAFVVAGVLQFTSIWNDFLFGLVLLTGPNVPASVALAGLKATTDPSTWNILMAGAVWFTLPLVVVYLVLGKYLVKGYMSGSIKG
ncbi:MAG TPA: carbohydrate ABC transporter permease [Candidatus Acidoferrum sp.]|nr:carbohydrate ABC transporter permease [Candidatus Acidoferrum sp.]